MTLFREPGGDRRHGDLVDQLGAVELRQGAVAVSAGDAQHLDAARREVAVGREPEGAGEDSVYHVGGLELAQYGRPRAVGARDRVEQRLGCLRRQYRECRRRAMWLVRGELVEPGEPARRERGCGRLL